jgi:hypothetical protein
MTSVLSSAQLLPDNSCITLTSKLKVPRNRPEGPEGGGGRGIALLFLDLGVRWGWVVSTTPRPLYPRETRGTHCTGGWVGPRACLDVCEKSRPHRDSIPGPYIDVKTSKIKDEKQLNKHFKLTWNRTLYGLKNGQFVF